MAFAKELRLQMLFIFFFFFLFLQDIFPSSFNFEKAEFSLVLFHILVFLLFTQALTARGHVVYVRFCKGQKESSSVFSVMSQKSKDKKMRTFL